MTWNTSITGTGSYLPERVVANAEIARRLDIDPRWILRKTHVRERRIAAPGEATSDLATHAADRALRMAGLEAADVDLIVLATSTPDQPIPATACFVQANLGAVNATAFDLDAVCTGFVYAFVVARSMLLADPSRRTALVIGADTYSRILDYTDRSTAVLFGDGAGAAVLTRTDSQPGVLATALGSDGTKTDFVQIPAGGSRLPPTVDTVAGHRHYFMMRGRESRGFVAGILPRLTSELMKSGQFSWPEVDLVVPHQANGAMLAEWADALPIRPGTLHLTVQSYGNTGAASVPITLDDAVSHGRVSTGDLVLLLGFGGGVTWGGVALRWHDQGTPITHTHTHTDTRGK